MTLEETAISLDLLQRAVDATEHPAKAVSILISAAATILERSFGQEAALDLMTQGIDAASAELRKERHLHG